MPVVTIKDLLESRDGTVLWGPLTAMVAKAPQTVKRSPGARGEDWVRATLTLQAEGASIELVLTDPLEPYLSNPKLLEGNAVMIDQGAKLEEYKGQKRLRAYGKSLVVHGNHSTPIAPPAPTSAPQGASYAPPPAAQAHPLMAPAPGLTDRALLQAYAAWAPKLWAILDPGLQAAPGTAQAVAACLNTLTIAVGQGKLAVTLYAEEQDFSGDFDAQG